MGPKRKTSNPQLRKRSLPNSLVQSIYQFTNDLNQLIPIGTLNFIDIPLGETLLYGLETGHDDHGSGWKWADLDFLLSTIKENRLNPLATDLLHLIRFRYLMATYKTFKVRISQKTNDYTVVCKIRLYGVPTDVGGSLQILRWRDGLPKNWFVESNYKRIWTQYINTIDYSEEGWNTPLNGILLLELCKTPMLLISFIFDGADARMPNHKIRSPNFHIDRWTSNKPFLLSPKDASQPLGLRLQEVYNSIMTPEFPALSATYTKAYGTVPTPEETLSRIIEESETGEVAIDGVKSKLYPFQVKSLSKMLEKESSPKRALIPNMIKLKCPNLFNNYYFDLFNYRLYTSPELYALPRGGILGESMGVGKTLICLSLVCLTKFDVSTVPEDLLLYDDSDEDISVLYPDQQRELFSPKPALITLLVDICKKTINQCSLPWKYYLNDLPTSVVKQLLGSAGSFKIPLKNLQYASAFSLKSTAPLTRWRQTDINAPAEGNIYRTLYLCNTTLIIVPDNIFHQWNNELKKHIEPTYLKKLFISNHFNKSVSNTNGTFIESVPSDVKTLLDYDLIIISTSLLVSQISKLKTGNSPLNNVYWKRLIIDEGHSLSSKSKTSDLCKNFHAERRWAVSGTPTSGLTRLQIDEQTDEQGDINSSPGKKNKYLVKTDFNEKEDLLKLSNIVSNFLKIEPFYSQPKAWQNLIAKPFIKDLYGSKTSLTNLLNEIMVRHNLGDIDQDLKLPQLHHEAVFLEPSYHNKISINLFTAVLAVNAVSSERTDVDYMFHPANRPQLRRLVTNLQRATFHWTGFQQEDVEGLIHVCVHSLKKRRANGKSMYSDYDLSLVKQALEASRLALSNPRWRTSALLHEMNYYLSELPDIFTKSFGTGVLQTTDSSGRTNDVGVFGAPHIQTMQEFFYKNRFLNMSDAEKLNEKLDAAAKPFWSSYWQNTVKRNTEKFNKQDTNQSLSASVMPEQITNAIETPSVLDNLDENSRNVLTTPKRKTQIKLNDVSPEDKLKRTNGEGLKMTDDITNNFSTLGSSTSYQSIRESRLLGTASSKLSYLASRLLEHQKAKVKSIVFFEFEDSAYYLTELLELMGIGYILYATFISPTERANNLAEFGGFDSENNGGITLIMDLRLASHGLTVISATRVYFISPVWHRSVEAQAIKRAHRIGQTKDVYVETLVLKGTLEEEIYKKRSKETDSEIDNELEKKNKFVIDDTGMQDFILKHKFLDVEENDPEYSPFFAPALNKNAFFDPLHDEGDILEYTLLEHKDIIHKKDNVLLLREWIVYVFSKECLDRLNLIKAFKTTKRKHKDEFLFEFAEAGYKSEVNEKMDQEPEAIKKLVSLLDLALPKRKKVRF